MRRHLTVLTIIFTVGFGCKFFKNRQTVEPPREIKTTVITKDVLTEKLLEKGVKLAAVVPQGRPNPLSLYVRFSTGNNNFLLNAEGYDNFGALANTLSQIFKEREQTGIFIEGTNDIYKKITLPAFQSFIDEDNAKGIFVEDFEKLVGDLQGLGFDQIELDTDERNLFAAPGGRQRRDDDFLIRPEKREKNDSAPPKSGDIKTISGGIINGKAVNLPKPVYPPAARAVRAEGAVNVRVTVDENGDVVSANAVSGHPLLRASAVAAAREAKFKPTILADKPVRVDGLIVFNFKLD